jgi:lipoic acid synthetase
VDENEPLNVALAVKKLGLRHVVITSVTRDDLEDGGAEQFVQVIEAINKLTPGVTIEVLIPDLKGNGQALQKIVNAKPKVINHNVETVPNLYPNVRPGAVYSRSLELLKRVKQADSSILTKSGIMLGLGEKEEEVIALMKDLREVDCDILTIGQYLAPSKEHHPIVEYIHPDVFKRYEEIGLSLGFKNVPSSPLTRSSYNAGEIL